MKKLTLTAVSVLAIAAAGANAANFHGFNAGVRAKYNWFKQEIKEPVTGDNEKFTVKPKGISGDLVLGYMHNLGNNFVVGAEAYAGWANYEGKKSDIISVILESRATVKRSYSLGLDILGGYEIMPELLGYVKAGIGGSKNKYMIYGKDSAGRVAQKDFKRFVPNASVGFGAKYVVMDGYTLDAGYTYSQDLNTFKLNVPVAGEFEAEKGNQHTIHVGVSYQF